MRYSDNYLNKEFIEQMNRMQEIENMINSPALQEALDIVNSPAIQHAYQSASLVNSINSPISTVLGQYPILSKSISSSLNGVLSENILERYQLMSQVNSESMQFIKQFHECEHLITSMRRLDGVLGNYNLLNCYSDDISDEEAAENEEVNNKIVTEIFKTEEYGRDIQKKDSGIITLSAINDKVLKYLADNPEAFYQLDDRDFETVMAEIYNKLGYKVELTKSTRDGGKDIIIRKPEVLGDFIYYVECKKYAAKRHIGVGIIRNLVGTISTDRVNGGILATTSFFTKDARDYILEKDLGFQIKLHDYDVIRNLLNKVI